MTEKTTLGRLPRDAIRLFELPRLPDDLIEGYKALVDLTGTISDAMDELGIVGVVPACALPPVNTGTRVVGRALTLRNIQRTAQIHKAAQEKTNTQGESEAHNLAEPGDVLVIEGVMGCSNMGGQSATIAKRQGFAGAVVDGTVRDPRAVSRHGLAGLVPRFHADHRQVAHADRRSERQGAGLRRPGEPRRSRLRRRSRRVLRAARARPQRCWTSARKIDGADTKRKSDIDSGVPVSELMQKKYK